MKLFWTIALALAAAACTPMQWVKEDSDPQQAAADSRECQMQAWQEARWRAFMYQGMYGPVYYRDALGRPFVAWQRPFYDPFADPFLEESRLLDYCMRARGYALQPMK
jgi:hypothetical protein